ncbi:DUF5719 family protein [Streptomyces sp. A3M-1-3]|uniref:DUF5719 family protein n=1 Tax=Streptomyces sp. A3M-1-3 TaxID=2962044 RepID=UPI0020B7B78E|nr:DUF5719 family protein [Streptomyces sp. A3M-1-3]MCP3820467.1 DUF5719 family protein [Streptomyces sp. A3M-1-3]
MNRPTLSLIAAAAALAAVTGFAALTAPGGPDAPDADAAARLPVERSSLLCPAPSTSDLAETTYTSFTPAGGGSAGSAKAGTAQLMPSVSSLAAPDADKPKKDDEKDTEQDADQDQDTDTAPKDPAADKPVVSVKEPGKPAAGTATGAEAPALIGAAEGRLAPGWAAQQTTTVTVGGARGVLGVSCTPPDTDFWFPAASTAKERQDYVHLTNPDDTAAVVDIELYGPEGALKAEAGEGIPVPAKSSVPVLLSTLTGTAAADVTVHVTTRTGRVGASVQAMDDKAGSDWLPASADPAGSLVLPGVPADATSARLVAFVPGQDDADLKVRLAGPTGSFTPASAENLHVKSGMTTSLELKDVTKGEVGSLVLTPAEGRRATPVVAALRVTRGTGVKQEVAFIPAAGPVGERATVADNRAKGSVLSLVAPESTVKVKVTASAGTEAGAQAVETYTVKAGTTLKVQPPVPAGLKGSYALTVETESGGPLHAARTLELPEDGIPMFTVQTLSDDRGTVAVPRAVQDLSVLDD